MTETGRTSIEEELLNAADVDREKLAEFGKIMFMLNGFQPGPLPDKYVILCTKPNKQWCVAQLWADQEKPFRLLEGMCYPSLREAETAVESLRQPAGPPPDHSIQVAKVPP
jgi:hypothetical protein